MDHIIFHDGVKVDPHKTKAMMEFLIQKNLKNIRIFLGMIGYYHKFVKNYGRLTTSLTTLLKKNAFSWNQYAIHDFEKLKKEMCRTLVLATLEFTKTFVVECDASVHGIGVVLM